MWPAGTSNRPEYEATGLKPGTSYAFRVCAVRAVLQLHRSTDPPGAKALRCGWMVGSTRAVFSGKVQQGSYSRVLQWPFQLSGFRRGAKCWMGAPHGDDFLFCPAWRGWCVLSHLAVGVCLCRRSTERAAGHGRRAASRRRSVWRSCPRVRSRRWSAGSIGRRRRSSGQSAPTTAGRRWPATSLKLWRTAGRATPAGPRSRSRPRRAPPSPPCRGCDPAASTRRPSPSRTPPASGSSRRPRGSGASHQILWDRSDDTQALWMGDASSLWRRDTSLTAGRSAHCRLQCAGLTRLQSSTFHRRTQPDVPGQPAPPAATDAGRAGRKPSAPGGVAVRWAPPAEVEHPQPAISRVFRAPTSRTHIYPRRIFGKSKIPMVRIHGHLIALWIPTR